MEPRKKLMIDEVVSTGLWVFFSLLLALCASCLLCSLLYQTDPEPRTKPNSRTIQRLRTAPCPQALLTYRKLSEIISRNYPPNHTKTQQMILKQPCIDTSKGFFGFLFFLCYFELVWRARRRRPQAARSLETGKRRRRR